MTYERVSALLVPLEPFELSPLLSMPLRHHQQQILKRAKRLKHERKPNTDTFTEVIPGGGKSRNVSILFNQLRETSLAQGVVWISPRRSLQVQAVESALAGPGGGQPGVRIGESHKHPTSGGFATNFHSLLSDPKGHLSAIKSIRGPLLLVVDEVHCVRGGRDLRGWGEAFAALRKEVFDRGGHQLGMSGTVRRWDGKPVVSAPYDPAYLQHLDPVSVIAYDRQQGIGDDAIVRIQPQFCDGPVQWQEADGKRLLPPKLLSSFGVSRNIKENKLLGRALRAFLSDINIENVHMPAIWDALANRRRGWLGSRGIYGNNQIIIAAPGRAAAIKIVNILNSPHFRNKVSARSEELGVPLCDEFRAVLAISGVPDAFDSIASFRCGWLVSNMVRHRTPEGKVIHAVGRSGQAVHCLVTVDMASIGMDAPAVTHLVNFNTTRSIPFITQLFARAWRSGFYDWPRDPLPVNQRRAYVWMPDDIRMRLAFAAVCDGSYASGLTRKQREQLWHLLPDPAEESEGLEALADREPDPKKPGTGRKRPVYAAVPSVSRLTGIRVESPQ